MFEFTVNEKDLKRWATGFNKTIVENMRTAQAEIRRDWVYELYRQQQRKTESNSKVPARALIEWDPLKPWYKREKERQGYSGQFLRRTGAMLRGYAGGVFFDKRVGNLGVYMPFPKGNEQGDINLRAKVHQGLIRRPKGVPARPFAIDGFHQIAVDRFKDAIEKSIKWNNNG